MVKVVTAEKTLNMEHVIGKFADETFYDTLVEEDYDYYLPKGIADNNNDELRIAFKFRKNFFNEEERKQAYLGLREAAVQSQNRGLAAGPRGENLLGRDWVTPYQHEILEFLLDNNAKIINDISIESIREKYKNGGPKVEDTRGFVWLRSEVEKVYPEYSGWFDNWVNGLGNLSSEDKFAQANKVANDWVSTTNYAKPVFSGVAGWYDRYPRIPYGRATAYTERNPELFALAYPFLQSLNRGFRDLLPWRWSNQNNAASQLDRKFLVPETVFTTITVNKSFRTACHRDGGDLTSGISNLLVLGDGEYTGGYLVFPEIRVAVNVRPGDLLLVNNHEIIHGNTEIKLNSEDAERISLVCYFREKMLELKSWEYEQLRRQYVDERRLNKDHKLWKPLWNGVSAKMWDEEEWFNYLNKHNIPNPYKKEVPITLENFFS